MVGTSGQLRAGLRVLVVEDEALIAEEIGDRLHGLGHRTVGIVDTGAQAIDSADRERPDLVLMDIRLKGPMDGIDAATTIYERFDIPIVYVTAHSDTVTLERARRSAPFGFVVKPFRESDLLVVIQTAIGRHEQERQLKEGELSHATVLASISDGVLAVDLDGCVRYLNQVAELLTGWSAADARDRPAHEVVAILEEATGKPADDVIARVLGERVPVAVTGPFLLARDGTLRRIEGTGAPVFDRMGRVLGAVLVLRDTSERHRAEERMRLVESAPDPIIIVDDAGDIVLVNRQTERTFGHAREKLLGRPATLLIPGLPRAPILGEPGLDLVGQRKDGSSFPVEVRVSALETEEGPVISVDVRDVSERRAAEAALRASEERFRTLVEQASDGIFTTDSDGGYLDVNSAGCALLGYQRDEILNLNLRDVVAAEDRPRVGPALAALPASGSVRSEWRFRRKDGTSCDGELSARMLADGRVLAFLRDITERKRTEAALGEARGFLQLVLDTSPSLISVEDTEGRLLLANRAAAAARAGASGPKLDDDAQVVRAGRRVVREELVDGPRGETLCFHTVKVPLPRPDGSVSVLCIATDVTEQKRLEEQLRQSQKLQAIGQLAGGVAHDFNNMLMVINSNCEFLLERLSTPAEHGSASDIHEASRRAALLTRQLLLFGRRAVLNPRVLDLNHTLRDITRMLVRLLGEDVELDMRYDDALSMVKADPGQLEQVVINLALNGRDAMPEGGRLTIVTANVVVGDGEGGELRECRPGPYVRLSISDTGTGMTPEVQAHLFEPFFTTKGPDKGTGLGLATVYGIVHQSGGTIEVASELHRGTVFTIYLPAASAAREAEEHLRGEPALRGRGETLLVVEDELMVRNVVCRSLEQAGYRVVEAASGPEALAASDQHIDLLLTDVVMPGMSGRHLAELLRARRPTLRVLYMSGHTDDAVLRHGILEALETVLQKPFSAEQLGRRVRQLLDSV